jgi:ribosomal protein S18 acetylase RimI-like enzyme
LVDGVSITRLAAADLAAYKALRDTMLAAYPAAFTSDAASESSRNADSYQSRLGLDRPDGGQFALGAWRAGKLVGAIGCEREARIKVRHVGHVIGMMVLPTEQCLGVGRALLAACIAQARQGDGIEMLTLTVTAGDGAARRLYERAGFQRYGTLMRALKVGASYHDKDLMVLTL